MNPPGTSPSVGRDEARRRVLDDFPYPVAYPYSLIFDVDSPPSVRRWALCFTEYQLLRIVCLPLVGQYLREAINQDAAESISALNSAIAAIRSPFFSDWIALIHNLNRHLPLVGIEPLFSGLAAALESLRERSARPFGLRDTNRLDPLRAILALRNGTAHGGIPDEQEAAAHLDYHLPVLHEVLQAFDFLGDTQLLVSYDDQTAVASGRARLRRLRGVRVDEPAETDLADDVVAALQQSSAALLVPGRRPAPLDPLFNPVTDQEPLYLYDGHYGIRVETKQGAVEPSYIYYLGTHHRAEDAPACLRLKDLLARRKISFLLPNDKTAPWTIADSAADYSRRTLDDLLGTKYFPQCYLPFESLERDFAQFLRTPKRDHWPFDTKQKRYVNGFVLIGLAGAGKTAFFARQVQELLRQETPGAAERENPNLVLFLRGNGMAEREAGPPLFRDVAEKLGVAVDAAGVSLRQSGKGFSSFRELLDHLHSRWKDDRIAGRRLILVFDALNEAPLAADVTKQALELMADAACYPWCKVAISTRQEWLGIWSSKMDPGETSRLEELRPWLYVPPAAVPAERRSQHQPPPVVFVEPFTSQQAAEVYGRYQRTSREPDGGRMGRAIPACLTPWEQLSAQTQELLINPLHLHLFMETFDRRPSETLRTVPDLFRRYADRALAEHPALGDAVEAVVAHLLASMTRASADLNDDDCNAIRSGWASKYTPAEARMRLSPLEALAHEGLVTKRVREEGGGYRFVFQAVAEYLIYRHLSRANAHAEDELAYWTHCASPAVVFPEYAGAVGFLLRDWATEDARLAWIGPLVESGASWMTDVLTTMLVEQARTGYVPGEGSTSANQLATSLARTGGTRSADALYRAALELASTSFAVAAIDYFQASVTMREALWAVNTQLVEIGAGLGSALNNLGALLNAEGRVAEAEPAYRRCVEIYEALWAANPQHVEIGAGLGGALNNLGNLLSDAGRVADGEAAYRHSVWISEALWVDNPENVEIGYRLASALTNLGILLNARRGADAEMAYGRSVEIGEALWAVNPGIVRIGDGLASAFTSLGVLLSRLCRVAEAEAAYGRSVEIGEALWADNPHNVGVGGRLARALTSLGFLLSDADRVADATTAYRRSVEISEALWVDNPKVVDIGDTLASELSNLGALLSNWGRLGDADAEAAYRRSVQIYNALWVADPHNVTVGTGLGRSLNYLGVFLSNTGRVVEAEAAYRRSIEIREVLWAVNPENVDIGAGLGSAQNNLGSLCREAGRMAEAEAAYRRSVEIYEALWADNPQDMEIKLGFAGSLGNVERLAEAATLVDQVLALMPQHPFAKELKRNIETRQGSRLLSIATDTRALDRDGFTGDVDPFDIGGVHGHRVPTASGPPPQVPPSGHSEFGLALELVNPVLSETEREVLQTLLHAEPADRNQVKNARAVCLLRLGQVEQSIQVFRQIALSGLEVSWKRPIVFRTNLATALLASQNLSGCEMLLGEMESHGEANDTVRGLRQCIQDWKRNLSWKDRLKLALFGAQTPIPLDGIKLGEFG